MLIVRVGGIQPEMCVAILNFPSESESGGEGLSIEETDLYRLEIGSLRKSSPKQCGGYREHGPLTFGRLWRP